MENDNRPDFGDLDNLSESESTENTEAPKKQKEATPELSLEAPGEEFEGKVIPLNDLISISQTGDLRGGVTWREALQPFIDDLSSIPLTSRERYDIEKHLAKNNSGIPQNVPLRCLGPECPFAETCPFVQLSLDLKKAGSPPEEFMGKIPLGKPCPIEQNKIAALTSHFADAYKVERNDYAQFMMCVELAILYVFDDRLSYYLATPQYAMLIDEDFAGTTREGDVLTQKKPSPAMELKLKIAQRRSKILNDMVATRKAILDAAKQGTAEKHDLASAQASLEKKMERLERDRAREADFERVK